MSQRARRTTIGLAAGALLAFGCAPLVAAGAARAPASVPSVSWGQAAVLPGLSSLAAGGGVDRYGQQCASTTRCTVYGLYHVPGTEGQDEHLFVEEMENGSWGTPEEVPGLSSTESAGGETGDVACMDPGECVAYGSFNEVDSAPPAFVLDEVSGTWGTPHLLTPVAVTPTEEGSTVWRVACHAVGACAAVGDYLDAGTAHPFVANEVGGVWGPEVLLHGLNVFTSASYDSALLNVQCPAIGDCLASGFTLDNARNGFRESFLVQEHGGVWSPATRIPWLARRNTGGFDQITALACPRAGWCTIGGYYQTRDRKAHYFVQSQHGGQWLSPVALGVPGFTPKNADPSLKVQCPQLDRCDVVGYDDPSNARSNDFVLTVLDGVASAIKILPDPIVSGIRSRLIGPPYLSCVAFDACGLAASFDQPGGLTRIAVSNLLGRTWSPLAQAPPFAGFDPGTNEGLVSVQCLTARYCVAIGSSQLGVFVTH
jgi:hypothetical protein